MIAIGCGTVKIIWKYWVSRSSDRRSSNHWTRASDWHFGQWRSRQLMGVAHYLSWTKPLRGSAAWQPLVPSHRPAFLRKSDCDIMEALFAEALPCRKGASHDCSSTTNDGGYAGSESVDSHAGIVSSTGFAVRTPLR